MIKGNFINKLKIYSAFVAESSAYGRYRKFIYLDSIVDPSSFNYNAVYFYDEESNNFYDYATGINLCNPKNISDYVLKQPRCKKVEDIRDSEINKLIEDNIIALEKYVKLIKEKKRIDLIRQDLD